MTTKARLLPPDQDVGWTPCAYLIYLGIFFFEPLVVRSFSAGEWALQAILTISFLALFFRGFWLRGRRLYPIIAAILLIGVVAVSFNGGGSTFFIYAAGFLGDVGPPKVGLRGLALIQVVIVATIFALDLHPATWLPAVIFSVMIGGLNIHFGQVARRNRRLRMAQDEVERLAKSDERERIARDLHDLLGHTLSVVTVKSQLAARLLERQITKPEAGSIDASELQRALQEIREVESTSREAMAEVRRAVRGFRSLKLGTELAKARMALEAAGVALQVESTPYDLDADQESVLALALREAVTNVVRHARANACDIGFRMSRGEFELTVEDDGRGIRHPEGSGLMGMRERIEAIGGTLEVDDYQRLGTRLRAVVPTRQRGVPTEHRPNTQVVGQVG